MHSWTYANMSANNTRTPEMTVETLPRKKDKSKNLLEFISVDINEFSYYY